MRQPVFFPGSLLVAACLLLWMGAGEHASAGGARSAQPKPLAAYGKLPLSFEANQGQTNPQVKFLARGRGATLFLAPTEAVLALRSAKLEKKSAKLDSISVPSSVIPNPAMRDEGPAFSTTVLRMKFVGANPSPQITGAEPLPGRSNYFIGNDPTKWRTNVPHYARVRYEEVWPGIDLEFYGTEQGQLEYDFIVAPGAAPSAIRLAFQGAEHTQIDETGNLVLGFADGAIQLHEPYCYQPGSQQDRTIVGHFIRREDRSVGIRLASYNRAETLIIDPVLVYSTYLGGSSEEFSGGIDVDALGNVYLTGQTISTDFPTTAGSLDTFGSAFDDIFITKINSAGSGLVYSTYLGGRGTDRGRAIAVDGIGNAYITGLSNSSDFPTTPGAFQTSFAGGAPGSFVPDVVVAKLNATGNALVYSTYVGGTDREEGSGIALDASGSVYVSGSTASTDFPTTTGVFQPSFAGGARDVFVFKLNASGSSLVYSTFLGGSADDPLFFGAAAIAIDGAGNAHVTGQTLSSDFPTTPGAFQESFQGGTSDVIVTKLNADGTALIYSTYLSGSDDEFGDSSSGIAVDAVGNAYVGGSTGATNFPVTPGAFHITRSGGNKDGFVAKLNPAGSGLIYSTLLGGNDPEGEFVLSIAIDNSGNAYVAGSTSAPDFPTFDPIQPNFAGGLGDAFVTVLNPTGSALLFSTYLGGSMGMRESASVALDDSSNIYLVGSTNSDDFPSANAFQPARAGSVDVFVTKIEAIANPAPMLSSLSPSSALVGTAGLTLTTNGSGFIPSSMVRWDGSDRTTLFVGSGELQASIAAVDLANAGTAQITVFNPAPGGGASNALTFTINNPMPSISGLVPDQIPAGSADFTLRVQGTAFRGGVSEVRWNGSPRPTTINVSGELEATVAAADVAALGTATVAVFNPGPGGGTSNGLPFTISLRNPVPTVTGLEPPGAVAGGGNFMLTVTGSNFVFNSDVHWNGSPQPTIWKNKQKLEATISAADILGPGPTTATVAVVNPAPGGGTSNPATFFITAAANPAPVIGSISPASAPVSRSGLALTVNGTAFQANSVVRLDGAPRPTTFASASQLQAALLPDDLTTAATRLVTVFTPVPGGGTSNDIAFTATNPLPTLSALSPANLPGGSSGFALTVTGTNFVPGSMVQWDGAALATSFVGPTTLRATVPAGNVATTGMVDVTVETPTPGGGTSAAQGFTITAGGNPPPALTSLMPSSAPAGRNGFLLTVDGSDFVHGLVVRWNGADRLTTFLSSTQLLAVISDADVAAAIPVDVTVFTPPPGGGLSMTSLPFTLLALPGPAPPAGHAPLGRARSEADTGTRVGTVEGATARSGATAVLGGETGRADEAKSKDRASSDPAGALREASGQAEHLFRTVVAEAPVIESVSPEEIKAGSGEVTLIVRGRGFREDSVARLNGRELETTYVSLFRLEATLTRADLPKPGTAQLTVFNPTDSKESAPQRLLVAPPH